MKESEDFSHIFDDVNKYDESEELLWNFFSRLNHSCYSLNVFQGILIKLDRYFNADLFKPKISLGKGIVTLKSEEDKLLKKDSFDSWTNQLQYRLLDLELLQASSSIDFKKDSHFNERLKWPVLSMFANLNDLFVDDIHISNCIKLYSPYSQRPKEREVE